MKTLQKGVSIVVIIAIIATALIVVGVSLFLIFSPQRKAEVIEKSLDELEITGPTLDFSLSPLPKLNTSSLSLASPDLPGGDVFSNFSLNTNLSYNPSFSIQAPAIEISIPTSSTSTQSSSSQAQSSSGQQQTDCSAFSAAPACSYVGAIDSDAYKTCKSCFPDK